MAKRKLYRYIILLSAFLSLSACSEPPKYENHSKLTYMVQNDKANLPDSPFAKELGKKTGIDVKYMVAQPGNYIEQLNILKLSESLPDIIENRWLDYSGGVQKAIHDGFIIPLNELIENNSPNLKKYLDEHPQIDKQLLTDDGLYYSYPLIRDDISLNVYSGFIIPTDWLENSNLPIPETIDDWERTLKIFRDEYNAESPIMINSHNYFESAFSIGDGFYLENGEVKYGHGESGFKDYLILMNRWYNEGLLQVNFPATHMLDATITTQNGKCGALFGTAGNTLGSLLKTDTPIVGVPYPVLNKGDFPFNSQYDGQYTPDNAAAISPSCKTPETAAKLLDFGYSDEGKLLYNFGIEGKSYTLINSHPFFTDFIINNPDGLSPVEAMSGYVRANTSAPCVQTAEYFNQYTPSEIQQLSLQRWRNTDAARHKLPALYFTEDESLIYSKKHAIEDYSHTAEIEFITGVRSIDEFDAYLDTLNEMGLRDLLSCYRSAYERYLLK